MREAKEGLSKEVCVRKRVCVEGSHGEHSKGLEKGLQKREIVTCWCRFVCVEGER